MPQFDVIVAGTGAVGSAALDQLARRGLRVLGIDRFPPAHDRGSSHGETRLIRQAYYEHPDYVPLLLRAYELWGDLAERAGEPLYRECGILEVSPPGGRVVPGVLASARQHGLDVEQLAPSEVTRRFPGFRLNDEMQAVFERRAGFLFVERCILAHATSAASTGAVIHSGETVRRWDARPGSVRVETDRDTYHAAALIITAGAWARDLLSDLGVSLDVVRKSLYWHPAPTGAYRATAGCPGFIFETTHGNFYGFPEINDLGVKAAEHTGGHAVVDPLTVDGTEDPLETERLRDFLRRYLPQVETGQSTRFATCLYTLSPDRDFILDRHPESSNVAFAAGLSGHGFKFASVLGEILADWAATGETRHPVGFLGLNRFRRSP